MSKSYAAGALREFRVALIKSKEEMAKFCARHGFEYGRFKRVMNRMDTSDPMMDEYLTAITRYNKKVLGA